MIDFQELKSVARIEELVRLYGGEVGRNGMTRCVLHSERTPSMKVDKEKGLFYCFGCGAGGDIIRLAQLKEGLSAPAAAKFIDSALGLGLDRSISPKESREALRRAQKRRLKARQEKQLSALERSVYSSLCGKLRELNEKKEASEPLSDEWQETVRELDKCQFLLEMMDNSA